ncbi:hypothetical protein EDF46_0579 [Frondihabitans sp. PhB188]|uniref:DUF4870 domain-containing protein n=1 Tax=Frondihabitans sp. PhB188 TaxID=2485200 RepID=UPI000F49A0DC|nr:DUF4870 domain-containing protein [Frondihabitans sp. PhB188]ROQ41203.1 hypothetical protein EDF46_0579 [Frondihabitans sp. PhB188]
MTDAPPPPKDDQPTPPPTGSYGNPGQYGQSGQSGQAPYGGTPGYQPPQPLRPEDEKLWATLIHIGGIPFGFIPALIGYLVLRDRGPFIKEHTRVALNFQITMAIAYAVGAVLTAVVIGGFIIFAVLVVNVIFSIIAAVAANRGQYYKYPLSIEFIKP